MQRSEQGVPAGSTRRIATPSVFASVVVGIALIVAACSDNGTGVEIVDAAQEESTTAASSTTTTDPSVDGDAAVATLDAYFAAYGAGDWDSAMSQFSTDPLAEVSFCFVEDGCDVPARFTLEQQHYLIAHNIAEGTENRDLSCGIAEVTPEEAAVRCQFEQHTPETLAVGAPGVPNVAIATVGPTGILMYQRQIGQPDYSVTFAPFMAWMRTYQLPDADSVDCCGWVSLDEALAGGEAGRRFAQAWGTYLEVTGCAEPDYQCERITDPTQVIEGFAAAYNAGNVDTMMAFFTGNAVVLDHPGAAETSGRDDLRALNERDRTAAAAEDPYSISNVVVDGDTVTWDHVWRSDSGEEFCAVGHVATVQNGRISLWQWPPDVGLCDES